MTDPIIVMTIGYQGRSISDFLDILEQSSVDVVVDVRSRPISRKHDFSKRRLTEHLDSRGIGYQHIPELGMPVDLLDKRCGKTGNAEILDIYRSQMSERHEPLTNVETSARSVTICLLCFETNPLHCHRSVVAEALKLQGKLGILHL